MHVAIAGHLGDHRGGRDRGTGAVALDHGAVGDRAARAARSRRPGRSSSAPEPRAVPAPPRERFEIGDVQAAARRCRAAQRTTTLTRAAARSTLGIHLLAHARRSSAWSRAGRPGRGDRRAKRRRNRSARRRRPGARPDSPARPHRHRRQAGCRARGRRQRAAGCAPACGDGMPT